MQVNLPLDGEQATSSLSRLPPELLLEIFSYLPPPDVKKCRLVSTALRVAGEPFLLPVMNLTFESSCFDRLEEICKIPSVCFGVHQIQYNINCLVRNSQSIDNLTAYHENRERRPPSTSTAQDQISTDWNPTVSQFHETLVDIVRRPMHYSDLDFRRTRTAYEAICRDQERMHQAGDNSAIITQAFKMLPNLTAVTVDVQPCYNVSFESNQLIQNTAGVYFSNNIDQMQLGYDVSQLRSLLNGTMEVGRPLKYLKCNLMSWRIFSQAKQDFENTTAALQQLKHLELTIDVECLGIYPDDHRPNVLPYLITLPRDEAVYARRYLLNGRVSDFLAAAPNLECLHFQWQRAVIELDLWMVVGTHTWSFLKTLHLWHIHTQSVVLRSLLSRHATTLRDVKLAFWSITDGLWAPMFLFMRQVLSLEAFKAYRLQGLEESDLWIPCGEHVARTDGRIRFNPLNDHLMDIITRYVTGNGHAPLLHREQKEFGEYLVDDGNGGLTTLMAEP